FPSKDDLAAEITSRVLGREGWLERLTGKRRPTMADVVRNYLSPRHRDDPGTDVYLRPSALTSFVSRHRYATRSRTVCASAWTSCETCCRGDRRPAGVKTR